MVIFLFFPALFPPVNGNLSHPYQDGGLFYGQIWIRCPSILIYNSHFILIFYVSLYQYVSLLCPAHGDNYFP